MKGLFLQSFMQVAFQKNYIDCMNIKNKELKLLVLKWKQEHSEKIYEVKESV